MRNRLSHDFLRKINPLDQILTLIIMNTLTSTKGYTRNHACRYTSARLGTLRIPHQFISRLMQVPIITAWNAVAVIRKPSVPCCTPTLRARKDPASIIGVSSFSAKLAKKDTKKPVQNAVKVTFPVAISGISKLSTTLISTEPQI